ncbi:MAG: glycosyltransferase family 87 protein [Candidatus Dormibacterales bacterium]
MSAGPRAIGARAFDVSRRSWWRPLWLAVLAIGTLLAARTALGTVSAWVDYGRFQVDRTDFILYYASALQGLRFGWPHLYDVAAQHQVLHSLARPGAILFFPNVYTPPMAWLVAPLTRLAPAAAYLAWSVATAAGLVVAWWLMARVSPLPKALLLVAALCPYIVLLGLQLGQVNTLQMACMGVSVVLLRRRRDAWAGLPLVVVALHPQGLELVPLALLAAGRWRAFATWAGAMAVVGLAVVAVIGVDGTRAYVQRLLFADAHPIAFWVGPWYTLPLQVGPGATRLLIEGLAALVALYAAWRHRGAGPELPIVAGILGSLLSSPFLHLYDLMWLVPAAWLLISAGARAWELVLLAAGFLVAVQCTYVGVASWARYLLALEAFWLVALALFRSAPDPSRQRRRAAAAGGRAELSA